ncbi:MAG: hypothetical protein AABY75_05345 [Bacteroidota bacterium]
MSRLTGGPELIHRCPVCCESRARAREWAFAFREELNRLLGIIGEEDAEIVAKLIDDFDKEK